MYFVVPGVGNKNAAGGDFDLRHFEYFAPQAIFSRHLCFSYTVLRCGKLRFVLLIGTLEHTEKPILIAYQ